MAYFWPEKNKHHKKIVIFCAAVILIFLSCKKKNDPTPNNNTSSSTGASTTTSGTTGGTTTGGSTTGGSSSTPTSNATNFHGLLTAITSSIYFPSGNKAVMKYGEAYFTAKPAAYPGNSGLRMEKVTFNYDTLTYDNASTKYSGDGGSWYYQSWDIKGSNGFPSFTYDATGDRPTCTNLDFLPDKIGKNAIFNFSVTVENTMAGSFVLSDNNSSNLNQIDLPLKNGINKITITSLQLNSLATTTAATIMVRLENTHKHLIGGKDFKFENQTEFTRWVELKN